MVGLSGATPGRVLAAPGGCGDPIGGNPGGAPPPSGIGGGEAPTPGTTGVGGEAPGGGGGWGIRPPGGPPSTGGPPGPVGIGGEPGNGNTATFTVTADRSGLHALRIRYSNPEQSPATHYNPDPLTRHADVTVNGGETRRVFFPHTFHQNDFWELTVPVQLEKGRNTLTFRSEELPNFDGTTYASDTFPGVLLRSRYAPLIDRIAVAPYAKEVR